MTKWKIIDTLILLGNVQNLILFWGWFIIHLVHDNSEWASTIPAYFVCGIFFFGPYIIYTLGKDRLVIELDRKYPGFGAIMLGAIFTLTSFGLNILMIYLIVVKMK